MSGTLLRILRVRELRRCKTLKTFTVGSNVGSGTVLILMFVLVLVKVLMMLVLLLMVLV